jgi:hypothetical protein
LEEVAGSGAQVAVVGKTLERHQIAHKSYERDVTFATPDFASALKDKLESLPPGRHRCLHALLLLLVEGAAPSTTVHLDDLVLYLLAVALTLPGDLVRTASESLHRRCLAAIPPQFSETYAAHASDAEAEPPGAAAAGPADLPPAPHKAAPAPHKAAPAPPKPAAPATDGPPQSVVS